MCDPCPTEAPPAPVYVHTAPVMGSESTAPVMNSAPVMTYDPATAPPVMGMGSSAGPVMGGYHNPPPVMGEGSTPATGIYNSIKEDDDDVTKKCKGDDPNHVMLPTEINMKKLLKGFGNTKQDICDAFGKIKVMDEKKQKKIFKALKGAYEKNKNLVDNPSATPE